MFLKNVNSSKEGEVHGVLDPGKFWNSTEHFNPTFLIINTQQRPSPWPPGRLHHHLNVAIEPQPAQAELCTVPGRYAKNMLLLLA